MQSLFFENICASLNKSSEVWQRLKISPNFFDLLRDIPTNFNLAVLEFDPDRHANMTFHSTGQLVNCNLFLRSNKNNLATSIN